MSRGIIWETLVIVIRLRMSQNRRHEQPVVSPPAPESAPAAIRPSDAPRMWRIRQ
jgi:hypothetical protein